MFCKNCGAEINDDARFCPNCGYDKEGGVAPKAKKAEEDNEVKLHVTPTFNLPYKLICSIGRAFLYFLLIVYFLTGYELLIEFPIIFWGIIGVLAVYVIIHLVLEKMQYNDLQYDFYATKIEYKDGFLNKEEKELKYKYIREVTLNKSIIERMFNMGTIRLFTNASSGMVNNKNHKAAGKNGIYIHCVKDAQEQYKKIKEIIDEGTENEN